MTVQVPTSSEVEIVKRVFGVRGDEAVRVAACESTGDTEPPYDIDPAAVNGDHLGAFQLRWKYHGGRAAALGYDRADMFELEPNARVAKALFDDKGWQPWTCRWVV